MPKQRLLSSAPNIPKTLKEIFASFVGIWVVSIRVLFKIPISIYRKRYLIPKFFGKNHIFQITIGRQKFLSHNKLLLPTPANAPSYCDFGIKLKSKDVTSI